MSPDVERAEIPPGLTVAGILEVVQVDPVLRAHCHVTIGGQVVPVDMYDRVRPKAGASLTVAVMPANGQTALRAVLVIAIAVAAVYTGGAAAIAFGGTATFGGSLAGAAAATAIPLGGPLALNALQPPLPPATA